MLFRRIRKKKEVRVRKVKKKRIVKDDYNAEKKSNEQDKIECNRLFTRYSVQNIGRALILDAETLRTTYWLSRRGFTDITVPNPFIYDEIKSDNRITAVDDYIGAYIKETIYHNHRSSKFTATWFDYCCSFDGNDKINPQEDIKTFFGNLLPKPNSTLAVTFCYRKHTRVDYTGQDEDRCRNLIEEQARLNGYNAVSQRTKRYKGMFFIIYKIY